MGQRLIAEDLLLLCWDDAKGKVAGRCGQTLPAGVGGALVVQALLDEALVVEDGRVRPGTTQPDDPLVAEVVDDVARRRRPPRLRTVVQRQATTRRWHAVRDRLVDQGVLAPRRQRLLGLIPVTRHALVDPTRAASARATARALLLGQRAPADAAPEDLVLAGLAAPVRALPLLVERQQVKEAKARAEDLNAGHGVPEAVGRVITEAQAAAMAAIAGAAAASGSSGSGS